MHAYFTTGHIHANVIRRTISIAMKIYLQDRPRYYSLRVCQVQLPVWKRNKVT